MLIDWNHVRDPSLSLTHVRLALLVLSNCALFDVVIVPRRATMHPGTLHD